MSYTLCSTHSLCTGPIVFFGVSQCRCSKLTTDCTAHDKTNRPPPTTVVYVSCFHFLDHADDDHSITIRLSSPIINAAISFYRSLMFKFCVVFASALYYKRSDPPSKTDSASYRFWLPDSSRVVHAGNKLTQTHVLPVVFGCHG